MFLKCFNKFRIILIQKVFKCFEKLKFFKQAHYYIGENTKSLKKYDLIEMKNSIKNGDNK